MLEEKVILHLGYIAYCEVRKRIKTAKDDVELCELDDQIREIVKSIKLTEKEIRKLRRERNSFMTPFLDASTFIKRALSFFDDNDRIDEICKIVFSLFEESPDLRCKIKFKEFFLYLGEYLEKPDEFGNLENYVKKYFKT